MFVQERNRALVMLVCAFLPLCFELVAGRDMISPVEWKVILFVFLYTAFVFQAVSCSNKDTTKFRVFEQCAKVSLLAAVAYCWLTFLHGMQQSIVTCLLLDTQSLRGEEIKECREGGLATGCIQALKTLNSFDRISTNCPQALLGSFIGKIYMVAVICFRCIAIGIVGLWNLYSWDDNRFKSSGQWERPQEENSKASSTKHMCGLLVCLLPCIVVEVAVPQLIPLSSLEVVVAQIVVFGLQYVIKVGARDNHARSILITMQKVTVCSVIFYTLMDFTVQCIRIIFSCVRGGVADEKLMEVCTGAKSRSDIETCYALLDDLQPSFYSLEKCPRAETIPAVLLYLANALKVLILTMGNTVIFFRGRKNVSAD
jgi:hypothetical protein